MQPFDPMTKEPGTLLDNYARRLVFLKNRDRAELANIQGVELRRTDALMRDIVENSSDGILTIRQDGQIGMANQGALRIFAAEPADIEDSPLEAWLPGIGSQPSSEASPIPVWQGNRETEGRHKDGSDFPLELSLTETWHDEERLFVAIVRDITERREQQQELEHQALHDALTGLPNRVLLIDRLEHALEFAKRERKPLALLLVDLDRFKDINDTLGHHVGDLVLKEVARRMAEPIRRTDTIARLGGDEFAILLPAVSDLARARRVAERIAAAVERSLDVVEGLSLEVGLSIGIALYPDHADEGQKLLQAADVAMYTAKQAHSGVVLYDPSNDHNSVRQLTLTGELRKAIENDDLSFHFQPKIDLESLRIVSLEALVRWQHPEHGDVPPDEFVRHAEQTGLIEPLTHWAFETALAAVADWRRRDFGLGIAINLSTRNLHEKALPEQLARSLAKWSVEPAWITLEITESAIMVDPESALRVVERIHDLGVRLSIDDFGTGYSSLAYLKRLPVDELKIDKSFVMQMTENESDSVIVRSTVDLAHNLGLAVVAEGVECDQHVGLLHSLGCDLGQGYHFSHPLPAEKLADWLASSKFGFGPAPV